jgi:hypothetical protein
MKIVTIISGIIVLAGLLVSGAFAQVSPQSLGLENKQITSLSVYQNVIAVGTDHQGVYYQDTPSPSDTGWVFLGLDTLRVNRVYAHNGPGPTAWIITAGVEPNPGSADYIFCSVAGQPFASNSLGILDTLTQAIAELDGFPTVAICGETFAAGNWALYRGAGSGTPWEPVYTTTIEGDIRTVRVHEEYPDVVLAGGADGFAGILLIKSLDMGDTWENISPFGMVVDLDFAGDSAEVIFAACLDKVFRSTNGGISWEEVFNGGGWVIITEVIFIPPSTVYIAGGDEISAGDAFIFFSDDLGANWQQLLPPMSGPVVDLEAGGDEWIYFVTPNNGVFRFPQGPVGTGETGNSVQPGEFRLFQNYPNPFNPSTNLGFRIWDFGFVKLEIFDITGRKMATLVSKELPPGEYEVRWDGRDDAGRKVSSGVYIYRLKAGSFVQSRKMLLIR